MSAAEMREAAARWHEEMAPQFSEGSAVRWAHEDAAIAIRALPLPDEGGMVERVGAAALEHMFDRRGIKGVLEAIRDEDPEVWAEIVEATGRAAIRAINGGEP